MKLTLSVVAIGTLLMALAGPAALMLWLMLLATVTALGWALSCARDAQTHQNPSRLTSPRLEQLRAKPPTKAQRQAWVKALAVEVQRLQASQTHQADGHG